MKVIDLLNKIANGEKLPEKIKFMGDIYYLNEDDLSGCCYFSEKPGYGGITLKFDTSVKFMGDIYYLNEDDLSGCCYFSEKPGYGGITLKFDTSVMNEEVEIIEEDKKDKEIEIYINGEKVDITDIYEPLKQGEYFYKENGKWYVHRLENISILLEEDKKIKRIGKLNQVEDKQNLNNYMLRDKINEIIDYLNKEE